MPQALPYHNPIFFCLNSLLHVSALVEASEMLRLYAFFAVCTQVWIKSNTITHRGRAMIHLKPEILYMLKS
ncbi:hypothetical protein Krac_7359 [Ktedonobacter racemifer DSM 44963]|uniref:Uncharacterized protein n=1 Tax=Ktedonobacter racemifer DSM 44963 TaxID=485913 RepID=D6TS17_KTERA|nr:hypothetical protein Krac_7359 [Ktedonobacter racemifer DSM 44963]